MTCEQCGQEHRRCQAHNNAGNPCMHMPAKDQRVCRLHGGSSPQALAKAEGRAAERQLRADAAAMGVPIEVDPGEALLAMVYEAAGNVAYLRARVQDLAPEKLYGLISTREGDNKSEPHVLVRMYDSERDRLAQCSALAVRNGIEERRVRMAEHTGGRLFDAVTAALNAAGLTPTQQEAFRVSLAGELRRGARPA